MLKKLRKSSLAILAILAFSAPVQLLALTNALSCSSYLDFVDYKLKNAPSNYPKKDVEYARKGFNNYNNYIKAIIKQEVDNYFKDNTAKKDAYIKENKVTREYAVNSHKKRYKDNKLYADFAMVIGDCSKAVPVKGERLEELKKAYKTFSNLLFNQ